MHLCSSPVRTAASISSIEEEVLKWQCLNNGYDIQKNENGCVLIIKKDMFYSIIKKYA